MKATKGKEEEIIQQLKGARCFMGYCREVGKSFWQSAKFLKDYQERFVSISYIGISKGGSRFQEKKGDYSEPERMWKIHNPHHLTFNQLAGKT
uniref:Uncharacterized protein n=1 Tax=Candidatus Kentrum sp. TUN TaxID=2126343 RepID=A0A450ZXF7_9GAMM|nr:MAG: hypothetical protein BECKTUN1418F_GA0071002_11447 [Candidatus Kentron sp. TUN]VFK60312.1 MAG: hypothetical protein BECKTUN1418D_GA0071000_11207 [Candidatus Kentron sp. TUN]VFK67334.1 MAG: hypothetical protein BECKTUN1418E_GA0071001_11427 [Candidatus Kentron sp. TUN]